MDGPGEAVAHLHTVQGHILGFAGKEEPRPPGDKFHLDVLVPVAVVGVGVDAAFAGDGHIFGIDDIDQTGKAVQRVSLPAAEIGFVLNPKYWGYSIAPEAARRVIRFGFDTLELHRIEARYMENNIQSRRVMEQSGMTFERIYRDMMLVRGQFVSVGVCSILRSEFNRDRIMSQLL